MSENAWRMTYNKKDANGCSLRGIAVRKSKEELEVLAEKMSAKIYNVVIMKNSTFDAKNGEKK